MLSFAAKGGNPELHRGRHGRKALRGGRRMARRVIRTTRVDQVKM